MVGAYLDLFESFHFHSITLCVGSWPENLVVGDSVAAITLVGDIENNVPNCDGTHACSIVTCRIEFCYGAVLSGDDDWLSKSRCQHQPRKPKPTKRSAWDVTRPSVA
jgi:hypothetical protein